MPSLSACPARGLVAALALLLAPAAALAQGPRVGCDLGDYDPIIRPDPEGTPTEVGVGVYIVQLDRVDNVEGSFRLDGFFTLSWRDERLGAVVRAADRPRCRYAMQEVWEPAITIFNRREFHMELPDVATVDTDGNVHFVQRIQSTLVAPMDLRDFPMDRQSLPLTFVSIEYAPESVSFRLDETAASRETELSISGWEIEELVREASALEVRSGSPSTQSRFARFDYEFRVRREITYYVWRVIGPLTFIVLMSWAVFWIDPGNTGVQIGLASTSILTLVAFLFSLNSVLPPLSYLTRMDVFLFSSLALAFLAFAEAVLTAVLKYREREALALRVDRWARWLFPLTFAVLHLVLWTT